MNVFEDLVVELKEENLLEETVIDRSFPKTNGNGKSSSSPIDDESPDKSIDDDSDFESSPPIAEPVVSDFSIASTREPAPRPDNIRAWFGDLMSALQLVDHVFGAVEATLNGSKANVFDDLSVKKAFHLFAQATSRPDSDEYFEAESALLSGMEKWEATLRSRDGDISVDAVRRYVEAANPPLSPQALFGLVRFYRKSEPSKSVYSKFDFAVTRLFSKFVDGEKRELLCSRKEIRKHLEQRYKDWSSGVFPPSNEDNHNIASRVLGFNNFISEAQGAMDLAELVSSRMFERLAEFKQSAGELFMVPEVASAAIDCNIQIADRVIDLVATDLKTMAANHVLAKNGDFDNSVVSDAVGRTVDLGALVEGRSLKEVAAEGLAGNRPPPTKSRKQKPQSSKSRVKKVRSEARSSALFGVNRWLLLATIITAILSVGIYVWAEYFAGDDVKSNGVRVVDLEKPELKEFIKTSKVSGSTLYGVVTPAFEKLSPEQQKEFLLKLRDIGQTKGYSKVSLINTQGKALGYASDARVELNGQ